MILLSLSACGSSGSGTVQRPSTEFTYVINRNGTVSAFAVNQALGTLRSLKGSPFQTGGMDSISATIDPLQRFLFVSNQGGGDLSVFQLASSGILKLVPGSPFVSGPGARSTAVTPDLKFLYVANTLANSIAAFSVNIDSGALTPMAGSPFAIGPGSGPFSLAVNPMGTRLYVTASTINQILAFNIAPDGSLTALAGSPFSTGHNPSEIRINPVGVFLYTTNFDDDDVAAFSIDPVTGTLAPLSGSQFAAGAALSAPLLIPPGFFFTSRIAATTQFPLTTSTHPLAFSRRLRDRPSALGHHLPTWQRTEPDTCCGLPTRPAIAFLVTELIVLAGVFQCLRIHRLASQRGRILSGL